MANIRLKSILELNTWNAKELRKLRITIKNRLSAFELTENPKILPSDHPLFEKEAGECRELLQKVIQAEKAL